MEQNIPLNATDEELKMQEELFSFLRENGITEFTNFPHKRLFTCEDADKECKGLVGAFTKTLLVKDSHKPEYNLFLIITIGTVKLNLKKIKTICGATKHLSFTNAEELYKFLKLTPGAVTPFGLINDKDKKIKILIDKIIYEGNYSYEGKGLANFHPNHNCASTTIKIEDLIKFIELTGHKVDFWFDSRKEDYSP